MRIQVHSKPNARKPEIQEQPDGLSVRIDAPACKNRANRRLIEILAAYYGVPKSSITIIAGRSSRHKVIDLPG